MEDDMTTTEISKFDDLIDIRDVIARVEELRDIDQPDVDELRELASLNDFLEECKGNGGDEQWEGDWYPVTCIRDSYFENYAQELAEDIGSIKSDAQWPYTCIDWEKAARELQMDYTSVEFDGITYWVR
jgi:antirestriction protein